MNDRIRALLTNDSPTHSGGFWRSVSAACGMRGRWESMLSLGSDTFLATE